MSQDVPDRYQRNANVMRRTVTEEYASIKNILSVLPPDRKLLDLGCAEGFICWLAAKTGIRSIKGIEIGENKVKLGHKKLAHEAIERICGDIFKRFDLLDWCDTVVASRFFHNVGPQKSAKIMERLRDKPELFLIAKYKPGPRKETGRKRKPLATKKGVKELLCRYGLATKSFRSQVLAGAKGEKSTALLYEAARKYGTQ